MSNVNAVYVQRELYPSRIIGDAGLFVFGFGVGGIVDSIDQMLLPSLPKHVSAHTKHELHGTGDDSDDLPAPNFLDKVELG